MGVSVGFGQTAAMAAAFYGGLGRDLAREKRARPVAALAGARSRGDEFCGEVMTGA